MDKFLGRSDWCYARVVDLGTNWSKVGQGENLFVKVSSNCFTFTQKIMSNCVFFLACFLLQSWSSLYPCVLQLYPPKCWLKLVDEKDFVSKKLLLDSSGLGPGRLVYKQKVIVIFLAMKRQLDLHGKCCSISIITL
jgi:hypothetical protein